MIATDEQPKSAAAGRTRSKLWYVLWVAIALTVLLVIVAAVALERLKPLDRGSVTGPIESTTDLWSVEHTFIPQHSLIVRSDYDATITLRFTIRNDGPLDVTIVDQKSTIVSGES